MKFWNIWKIDLENIFFDLINRPYSIRTANNNPYCKVKESFFKNTFFLPVIIEWNKLDPEIKNILSFDILKKKVLKFLRPATNNILGCHNLKGINLSLVTFPNISLNPLYTCG